MKPVNRMPEGGERSSVAIARLLSDRVTAAIARRRVVEIGLVDGRTIRAETDSGGRSLCGWLTGQRRKARQ